MRALVNQSAAANFFGAMPLQNFVRTAPASKGRLIAWIAALLIMGCTENDVGYVEIRTFPGFSTPLYLNSAKVDTPRNGSAILRRDVGKTKVELERNGLLLPVCEFDVRANRIITVTISTLDRLPRCDVQI